MEDNFNHINNLDSIKSIIGNSGFIIKHIKERPSKKPNLQYFDDLNLSKESKEFWRKNGYSQMWSHQKIAIEKALMGKKICISTSTSSGKTEIFQTAAIESLARKKGSKVLAVYSAKALNRQQKERWGKTGFVIGKIDGDDKNYDRRVNILEESDIVVMTPDVVHAFLLANVNNKKIGSKIQKFIKNIDLIIIDEIHLYRGVFGSNSAYLFRRLNNLRRIYRNDLSFPQYITASATLPNPAEHSAIITGTQNFINIGIEQDGSPTAETSFIYIEKDPEQEFTLPQSIALLVSNLTTVEDARSITFTNGRQQAGAYVMDGREILNNLNLEENKIYAFRAGGENGAREKILKAMEAKEFNGIISTSALEIGIDVSGLNICILANLPYDLNSYYQRIGRVGRGGTNNKSYVIIINDKSIGARILFDNGYDIEKVLPDLEPALHIDNRKVIHLQAAMHVDPLNSNSELSSHKKITNELKNYFPKAFCDFTNQLQIGQEPEDYKNLVENISNPHFISLRNMGENYRIIEGDSEKDEITRKQLYNEAYKGAVRNAFGTNSQGEVEYYNQRVERIDKSQRYIYVKREWKDNKTKPNRRTFLNPGLTKNSLNKIYSYGETLILNTTLREVQTIYGYYEIFFNNKTYHQADRPYRDSQYTTGMLIFHPVLSNEGVNTEQISDIFYYAFLMRKQFERTDIEKGSATLPYSSPVRELNIHAGDKFIAIYDANKLNITSELMNDEVIVKTFSFLKENLNHFSETLFENPISEPTRQAILTICDEICNNSVENMHVELLPESMRILAPKSIALMEKINETTGESEFFECKITGVNKVAHSENVVDYNVIRLKDLEIFTNVEMENIKPIDNSFYSEFDWEKGVIINR